MLTPIQLRDLVRELGTTKVLTVYHDARVTNPAMRNAWRPTLASALRPVRAEITNDQERAELDRAAAFLNDPVPTLAGTWGAPGWVAFLTAHGPRYAASFPVWLPTLVAWREGPVIAPYLRVLKQHRAVIVALVDSRSARFYRYAWGALTALPELTLSIDTDADAGPPACSPPRAISHPAPRSATSGELVQRHRMAAFRRLAARLVQQLVDLAGEDDWMVIGGTPGWARLAGSAMPPHLAQRVLVSPSLDYNEREVDIAQTAKRAATELRAMHGRAVVDGVLERFSPDARGATGTPAVQRALLARAVDLLVVSPRFVRMHAHLAEDMVRAALAQGADVEVLSSSAAEHFDQTSDGVGARLRFAMDRLVPADVVARTPRVATPRSNAG